MIEGKLGYGTEPETKKSTMTLQEHRLAEHGNQKSIPSSARLGYVINLLLLAVLTEHDARLPIPSCRSFFIRHPVFIMSEALDSGSTNCRNDHAWRVLSLLNSYHKITVNYKSAVGTCHAVCE